MARAFYRIIGIVGNGTDATPYQPRWTTRPECESWAACYRRPVAPATLPDRAIVLVQSTAANLQTLAGLAGVTYICSLRDLRDNVGTARSDIRTANRAYSGAPASEWWETMVGDHRSGD